MHINEVITFIDELNADFTEQLGIEFSVIDSDAHPARKEDIAACETALGISLPPSMREFLLRLNGGMIGSGDYEILAVGKVPSCNSIIDQSRFWSNELGRRLLVIANCGNGDCFCLLPDELDSQGEYPAAFLNHETREIHTVAGSYADWVIYLLDHLNGEFEENPEWEEDEEDPV